MDTRRKQAKLEEEYIIYIYIFIDISICQQCVSEEILTEGTEDKQLLLTNKLSGQVALGYSEGGYSEEDLSVR